MPVRARVLPLFVSLIAGPALAQAVPPKHLLRMSFEAGKTARYEQSTTMSSSTKVGERTLTTEVASTMWLVSTMQNVEGGKGSLQQKFERIRARATGMMQADYDSAVADARPGPFAPMAEMIGESVTLVLTDRGHVEAATPSPDFPPAAVQMFGGDLKQWLAQFMPELPEQPIAIGESWRTSVTVPGQMGEMKLTIDHRLAAVDGRRVRLDQTIALDAAAMQLPFGVKAELVNATGATTMDLATGMPVEAQLDMVMRITGTAATPMQAEMRMASSVRHIDALPKAGAAAEPAGRDAPATGK